MKKLILLIFILLLILVQTSLAQNVFRFFEFAPRSTEHTYLNTQTLIQPFIPFNDYLSIIGLWFDNNEVNSIRLKLIDQNNNILINKEIKIPIIYGSWYGEEYQIPLSENLKIKSGEEYKLIIEGLATSSLKVFSKNILEILQGSENYLYFPETLKPYFLNDEITNFTLKLSLYEGKESDPPIITNLKANIELPTSVSITFNANEPIMYRLNYINLLNNSTSTYSVDYFENCPIGVRNCAINLTTLPDTHYQFTLIVNDFWHNTSTLNGEFRTPKEVISTTTTTTTATTIITIATTTDTNETFSGFLKKSVIKPINQERIEKLPMKITISTENRIPTSLTSTPIYQTLSKETINLGVPQQQLFSPTSVSKLKSFSYQISTSILTTTLTTIKPNFLFFKFLQKQKISIFLIIAFSFLVLLSFVIYKKFIKK